MRLSYRAEIYLTFVASEVFFAGAFLLVTPTGLAALVVVVFFGPLLAPVFAVARFLVVVVVSTTVGKTLGREFPKCDSSASFHPIYALSISPEWTTVAGALEKTNQ